MVATHSQHWQKHGSSRGASRAVRKIEARTETRMDATTPYRAPRRWLRVSKYLLPLGGRSLSWRRTRSPREQVAIAQLAADHGDTVSLHTLGSAEALTDFVYECHASGKRQMRVLPAEFVAPAYVARIRGGMSFGRHCCVIGPASKAVRETGFYLDGAVLPFSRLSARYWRKRWEGDVTSRPWLPPKQRLAGRVAVLNTRFSHNFYHWLIDILPRIAPLRRARMEADFYVVESLSPFQQRVFAALGIQPHQLIQPHCRLLLEAEDLFVPSLPTPDCLREFRDMLSAALGIHGAVASPRRLFISRRKTGTRTLTNEARLESLLRSHGFETHVMEEYTLAEQARLVYESETIVATHGAGLANLLFARPNTRVVEIVPKGRFNATCYPKKSRILGLKHQLIFAERARLKQILTVSLGDVEEALARAQRPARYTAAA